MTRHRETVLGLLLLFLFFPSDWSRAADPSDGSQVVLLGDVEGDGQKFDRFLQTSGAFDLN